MKVSKNLWLIVNIVCLQSSVLSPAGLSIKTVQKAFSIENVTNKIREQLTSPTFQRFLRVSGKAGFVYLAIATSILIHELGHGLASKLVGLPPEAIYIGIPLSSGQKPILEFKLAGIPLRFYPLIIGGMTHIEKLNQLKPSQRIIIFAAGPLAAASFHFALMKTLETFSTWGISLFSFNPSITNALANLSSHAQEINRTLTLVNLGNLIPKRITFFGLLKPGGLTDGARILSEITFLTQRAKDAILDLIGTVLMLRYLELLPFLTRGKLNFVFEYKMLQNVKAYYTHIVNTLKSKMSPLLLRAAQFLWDYAPYE